MHEGSSISYNVVLTMFCFELVIDKISLKERGKYYTVL